MKINWKIKVKFFGRNHKGCYSLFSNLHNLKLEARKPTNLLVIISKYLRSKTYTLKKQCNLEINI